MSENIEMKLDHLPLGIKYTSLLQSLGKDGHCRIDGVRDDKDKRLGAGVGDGLGKGRANPSVDLV